MSALNIIPVWQWRLMARFGQPVWVQPDADARYVLQMSLPLIGTGLLADSQGKHFVFDTIESACAFAQRNGVAEVRLWTCQAARVHRARLTAQQVLKSVAGGH